MVRSDLGYLGHQLWRAPERLGAQQRHSMAASLAVGTLPAARLQQRRPAQQQQLSSAFLGGSVQQAAAAPLRPFAASSGAQQQRRVTCMAAKGEWGRAPRAMRVGSGERISASAPASP